MYKIKYNFPTPIPVFTKSLTTALYMIKIITWKYVYCKTAKIFFTHLILLAKLRMKKLYILQQLKTDSHPLYASCIPQQK